MQVCRALLPSHIAAAWIGLMSRTVLQANVPPGHLEQLVLPKLLNWLTGHKAHEAKLPAPELAENVSRGHCTHVLTFAAPSADEYVPATHLVQLAMLVAPRSPENVPCGHCMQSAAPGAL